MSELIKKTALLIFLTRPVVLIPVWGFSLFGFRVASGHDELFQWLHRGSFIMMLVFSLSVAAVYLLNQIEDYDVDSENGGYPLMVRSGISKNMTWGFTIFLALLSVIIPLALNHYVLAALSGFSLLIGYLYSVKPTYFTGRPILDFVSNGIGFGLVAFAAGWSLAADVTNVDMFEFALPYVLLMFGGSISSTLPDMSGDEACNKRTTAVVFGAKKAHVLAMIFIVLGVAVGSINRDWAAVASGAVSIPFYFWYLIKPSEVAMESCYKVGGAFMMLVIALFYPLFALFAFLVGIITMLYFRIIHQVTYPSLTPVNKNEK